MNDILSKIQNFFQSKFNKVDPQTAPLESYIERDNFEGVKKILKIKKAKSKNPNQTQLGLLWQFRDKPKSVRALIESGEYKLDGASEVLDNFISYTPQNDKEIHYQNVKVLLDKEPQLVNDRLKTNNLPLIKAAYFNNLEIGRTLLERGAHMHMSIFEKSQSGHEPMKETAFTFAADKRNDAFVDLLLSYSKDMADLDAFEEEISASAGQIDNIYYQKLQDTKETFLMKDLLETNVPLIKTPSGSEGVDFAKSGLAKKIKIKNISKI